ncbi:hypothetical protein [Catenulispora pinisilvae]|uniref:hypothetical protein n=1 Tax=Catenulispora pinisilvae TaxID=2705253 RepID=UPI0018917369|nr:hypothetical protein [Catenulispora pinisilvae]
MARRWVADFGEALPEQLDRAYQLVGITPAEHGEHATSVAAALAVVVAQDADPTIPDDAWRRIKFRHLDITRAADPEDETDPDPLV